tara:strand:+ start:227 stop:892 length:666 start_codon:yes stop_codon:yes gene_type:complete
MALKSNYQSNLEIGIDEAGRGPLFGRVYSAAVMIDETFDVTRVKDSKKYSSKKRLMEAYTYVIENSVAWGVASIDEKQIDKYNIRQATFMAMHKSIRELLSKIPSKEGVTLLIDGDGFRPFLYLNDGQYSQLPHQCIKGGDSQYATIAAASIIAKVQRDQYIEDLCEKYPLLDEYYGLSKNKGYGTKQHMEGLKEYGITEFHRASFSPCKDKVKIDLQITQ